MNEPSDALVFFGPISGCLRTQWLVMQLCLRVKIMWKKRGDCRSRGEDRYNPV